MTLLFSFINFVIPREQRDRGNLLLYEWCAVFCGITSILQEIATGLTALAMTRFGVVGRVFPALLFSIRFRAAQKPSPTGVAAVGWGQCPARRRSRGATVYKDNIAQIFQFGKG